MSDVQTEQLNLAESQTLPTEMDEEREKSVTDELDEYLVVDEKKKEEEEAVEEEQAKSEEEEVETA